MKKNNKVTLVYNGTEYIREHFIDVFFIDEFSCFYWNYYDVQLDGILEVSGHYFIYSNEHFPSWEPNGKFDVGGDNEYSYYTGKYKLKPISKFRAYFHIIRHARFKFCINANGHAEIREKNCPKIIKFFDKLARTKPMWVHKFTSKKLYACGTYYSDNYNYEII